MSPQMATELLVRFNASVSAWWLALILPAAAALAWVLYRVDHPGLTRAQRGGLTLLRIAIVLVLLTLTFRPDLVWRRTLRYPGRVVVLVDDSASMAARDDRTPAEEALRMARAIDPSLDRDAPAHSAASLVRDMAKLLREFELGTRGLDRASDAYWDRAGRTQKAIDEYFTKAGEITAALRAAGLEESMKDIHGKLDALLSGRGAAGRAGFEDAFRRLDGLAESLLAQQGKADAARVAAGDKALDELVTSIRARDRLALAKARLKSVKATDWPAGQSIEWVSLSAGDRAKNVDAITRSDGPTDIVGRVESEVALRSDFPLAGVLLVSDGRDTAARDTAGLERLLARSQSPVVTALAGSPTPPSDVSLVGVIAPPIATVGREVTLNARVRSIVAGDPALKVEALIAGRTVAVADVPAGGGANASTQRDVALRFTPDSEGMARVTVRVASVQGEVFPSENNSREAVVNIRKSPVRVLVLDGTPRWETRFAVNILQRLPYVELNTIFLATRADAALARGNTRGTWPGDDEAINAYNLILLGNIPPGTLTEQDGDRLRAWIERGGTLALLASDAGSLPNAVRNLTPSADDTNDKAAPLARLDQLALNPTGVHHPLTSALAGRIPGATESQRGSTVQPLLVCEDKDVLAWQPVGDGKVVHLFSDRLWEALNPTAHRAHQQLFVEIVTWAVEGGWSGPKGKDGVRMFVDRRRGSGDVQVWWSNIPGAESAKAEVIRGDHIISAATPVSPPRKGGLPSAVIEQLPTGTVLIRRSDESSAVAVEIVDENHELDDLSRDDALPARLAGASGGAVGGLSEIERLLRAIEPRERVEREERVWRLWDSSVVFGVLFGLLAVEWVWRKLVGRV